MAYRYRIHLKDGARYSTVGRTRSPKWYIGDKQPHGSILFLHDMVGCWRRIAFEDITCIESFEIPDRMFEEITERWQLSKNAHAVTARAASR